jgi:hypothetical protein
MWRVRCFIARELRTKGLPMKRALIRSLSVSLTLLGAIPLAHADDPNLVGCWRSQNSDQYYSDGRIIHLNGDCVSEISAKQIWTECQNANGRVQNLSTYEITAPGRYVATLVNTSAAVKEPPQPRTIEYVIDGEWLTLTFFPEKRANAPAPDKVVSLAVRVTPQSDKKTCQPRGPSPNRVGAGPVSSLLLTVPKTYVPVLEDPTGPSADPHLRSAINTNFLIGQFVLAGSEKGSAEGTPGRGYVLVVEDGKIGSRPIKAADFRQFKASRKQEIGQDKVSCDDEERLCFSTPISAGGQPSQISRHLTTEFVNVRGRIAIIYGLAFGGTPEDATAAKRSADVFAEQIVRDNP